MKNSVSRVNVNGMNGYCVDADTMEDAIKMLELYMEIENLNNYLEQLQEEYDED